MGGKKWPTQFPAERHRRLPLPERDAGLPSNPMPVHPSFATTRISQEGLCSLPVCCHFRNTQRTPMHAALPGDLPGCYCLARAGMSP
jgi:hypothetical protein